MNSEQTPDATSFGEILSEFEQHHQAGSGAQAVEATVVAVSGDFVFLDVGRKIEGVLPAAQFAELKPGDTLLVAIAGRNPEGYYELSTVKVERPKDWASLERAFAEQCPIAGVVEEAIKGGLRVDVGVRAFLPASRSGAKDAAEMEKLVGQEIQCRIIKLDVADEDVVVDRRAVLEEEERKARLKVFSELQEGAVVRGVVRSLTDFGAFVDLGGVDGLLHVGDMSWARVARPSDVVSVGDSIEVKILKINPDTRRVSLGLKQLQPDPWSQAEEKYKTGQRVRGRVSRVADFGAFVELEPGVEGLIHLSEMSWSKKVKKPSDVVQPDESVEVAVLGVNAAERRISLGLKQALGDPWEEAAKKFAPGTVVEGPVTSLTNFGAFIELGDGIDGMIHIGDITREKRLDHPREALSTGQKVRAVVLEVDGARRRIRLGMKQLEPTTVDEYITEHRAGEVVTGRLAEVGTDRARVELGEGVYGACRIEAAPAARTEGDAAPADLSALTARLAAKWKQGKAETAQREPARAGQIRHFRILSMNAAEKKIELELAS